MCFCHLACCYKGLPAYLAIIALFEFILGIVRIAVFFSPSSLLVTNNKTVAGFILDWISCMIPTLMGLLVALTSLIILCACLAAMGDRNTADTREKQSTGSALKYLWKNKPLQRLIQLSCNCPCYIVRPKLRFLIRLLFLFVCFTFRITAIALYASAGRNTNGGSLAGICAISLVCLFFHELPNSNSNINATSGNT